MYRTSPNSNDRGNKLVNNVVSTIVVRFTITVLIDPRQSDLLLSAAPVESHVGAVVVSPFYSMSILVIDCGMQDSPNACVTLGIPTGIFDHVRHLFVSLS